MEFTYSNSGTRVQHVLYYLRFFTDVVVHYPLTFNDNISYNKLHTTLLLTIINYTFTDAFSQRSF